MLQREFKRSGRYTPLFGLAGAASLLNLPFYVQAGRYTAATAAALVVLLAAAWIFWLRHLPYLVLTDTEIVAYTNPLRQPLHIPWNAVQAVEVADRGVVTLKTRGGLTRLAMAYLSQDQREEAIRLLKAGVAAQG